MKFKLSIELDDNTLQKFIVKGEVIADIPEIIRYNTERNLNLHVKNVAKVRILEID